MALHTLNIIMYAIVIFMIYQLVLLVRNYLAYKKSVSNIPTPYKGFSGSIRLLRDIWKVDLSNMGHIIADYCLQFSKEGIMMTWYPTRPILHLYKPHLIEKIATISDLSKKGGGYEMGKPVYGEGLLTSNGEKWSRDRKLIGPWFNFHKITTVYSKIIFEKCGILIECLEQKIETTSHRQINIFEEVQKCTYDIICQVAMGIDEDTLRRGPNVIVTSVARSTELAAFRWATQPWFSADFLYYLTREGREFKNIAKKLRNYAKKIVETRQKKRNKSKKENLDESDKSEEKVFLDVLLDSMDSKEGSLSLNQICDHVITIITAGFDTTSTAVSFCLFALGNNPDIQEKVHQEIQEVFNDSNDPMTLDHVNKLTYLDRVVKESLRYFPSAVRSNREVLKDFILDGKYHVPKGTTVAIDIFMMHHNPDIWEDPEQFDPDRFLPENLEKKHRFSYIPFSAGLRNCAASKLGLLQTKALVTSVLRKWRVKSIKKIEELNLFRNYLLAPHDHAIDLIFTAKK